MAGPQAGKQLTRSGTFADAHDGGTPAGEGTGTVLNQRPPSKPARRRNISERNRPLWMLISGGLLMLVIIVVPLILGIYMSTLNLDQYSLRKWISAPFIGVENFVEALTNSPLLHSVWLSVSYSLIAMVVTVPLGIAAAVATQNAFKGRALMRSPKNPDTFAMRTGLGSGTTGMGRWRTSRPRRLQTQARIRARRPAYGRGRERQPERSSS